MTQQGTFGSVGVWECGGKCLSTPKPPYPQTPILRGIA